MIPEPRKSTDVFGSPRTFTASVSTEAPAPPNPVGASSTLRSSCLEGPAGLEVLTHIPEDECLRRSWNDLVKQMECPEVFYTYEWAVAVQRAYAPSIRPLVFLLREHGVLRGIAALATDAIGKQVSFLNAATADYCDFVSRPIDRDMFVRRVMRQLKNKGFNSIVLANLPADSASAQVIRSEAIRPEYRHLVRPAYSCARVVLGTDSQRGDLNRVVAKKLNRKLAILGQFGSVSFVDLRCSEEILAALPAFEQAHIARFLFTGRISNQVSSARRIFLAELAELLSRQGWLSLSQLTLEGKPVAWNYGFRYEGSWFWYQPTIAINAEIEKASPGYCLLANVITRSCESRGVKVVDLGLGEEAYKARFANAERETVHVTLTQSWRDHTWGRILYRATTLAKSTPLLESTVRSVRDIVRYGRATLRKRGLASIAVSLWRRCWHGLFGSDTVNFYQWTNQQQTCGPPMPLVPLEWSILSRAAIAYEGDPKTTQYVLRAGARLRSRMGEGFALLDEERLPVHFAWQAPFHGFRLAELDTVLSEPLPASVVVFDCWTPPSQRRKGYFARATQRLGSRALAEGKVAWIFSAEANQDAVRGIATAGFAQRFSLIRKRFCGVARERQEINISPERV